MNKRQLAAAAFALSLAAGAQPAAQAPSSTRLAGLISDHSSGAGGPWQLSAQWSLHVKGDSAKADFSAAIAMQRSDLWVVTSGADPTDTSARAPHTHHVGVVDADVTALPNGFRVSGTAVVTGNGSSSPLSGSPVHIDVTGGTDVPLSNIRVTFGGTAAAHFGSQPLDGVVVSSR